VCTADVSGVGTWEASNVGRRFDYHVMYSRGRLARAQTQIGLKVYMGGLTKTTGVSIYHSQCSLSHNIIDLHSLSGMTGDRLQRATLSLIIWATNYKTTLANNRRHIRDILTLG
jgi:hypothetical protein